LDQATIDEVVASLQSGWLTTGPKVKQFEEQLQAYCSAPRALALNSGTAGLHLALLAMGVGPGDEVITTTFTFAATVNTIIHAGATPVLVDVDETLNIDLDQVEAAITPRTKAIVPVHFAGLPVDCDRLYAIAKKHGLRVLEDGAHAIGAEFNHKKLGSFGDTIMFSFHPNKNITTGEGGAILTHDEQIAQHISTMRFHGIDREAWNRFAKSGSHHYDVIAPGYKFNMLDLQGALGIHQLPKLDDFIAKRTHWVEQYKNALKDLPELKFAATPTYNHKHAWHLLTVQMTDESTLTRDEFMQALKDRNIGRGFHYQPVHTFTYYRDAFGYKEGDFPVAENIGKRILSLPLFPQMQESEFSYIIHTIKDIFTRHCECSEAIQDDSGLLRRSTSSQ
jgi:dTDP-4-amino-4,6-dideoxygalactose transaminase